MNSDSLTYFENFGVEYIVKKVKKIIGNKNTFTNIYRTQANDSVMCRFFFIGFIDFMPEGNILLDYTNLCFPNEYKKNDKITLGYFQ